MGHVNNAVYFTYMEEARSTYWTSLRGAVTYRALDFVVARAECYFRSPAVFAERVRVAVTLETIGTRSFVLTYEMTDEKSGREIGHGRTVQVMVDPEGRPRAVEPELRERMEQWPSHPDPPAA